MIQRKSHYGIVLVSVMVFTFLFSGLIGAQEKIVLDFWEGPPREGMYEAFDIAVKAFQKEYPNVSFNKTQVPWGDFAKKFQMGMVSGELPDLSEGYASEPSAYYTMGILLPLNDVVEEIGWEEFSEWTRRVMVMDGNVIGIPYINPPHVLWYRKDMLAKQGLEIPRTWSEWLEAAKKLTMDTNGDGSVDFYGQIQYLYDTEPQALTNLMYTSGGSTFDEEGNISINSTANKASLDFLKELWKYSQPGAANSTQNDSRILFMADGGAMIATSISLAAVLHEQAPEKRDLIGVAPIPKWEQYDGPWTGTAAFNWWIVPNTTKYPEIVKDFLRTFFRKDVYLQYCQRTYRGWLPVLASTQQDPEFLNHERIAPYREYFETALSVCPGSITTGQEYGANKFGGMVFNERVYIEMVERAVLQNQPTDEILKLAESRIQEIVETYQ